MSGTSGKGKARIDPEEKWIYPGLGWAFTLNVGNDPQIGQWSLADPFIPPIGEFQSPGLFMTYPEYRASMSRIIALSDDGTEKAEAFARLLVQSPLKSQKPALVDDYTIAGFLESVRWNDPHGARAALLIYDTLAQLPQSFLDAVGEVAIIRAKSISFSRTGSPALGRHLPFIDNPVLIGDDTVISQLQLDPFITDADYDLAYTFIHELAHVALARRAFTVNDRMVLVSSLVPSLFAAPYTWGTSLLIPPAYVYLRYFSPLSGEDFASGYAKAAGWVINNTNPFSFLWNDTTRTPNALSGWGPLGQTVGLRNTNAPVLPILTPPLPDDQEDKRRWDAYRAEGFPSNYAGVDVHEDWAESILAMALRNSIIDAPKFAPRRKFIEESGIWPTSHPKIEVGKTYFEWANSQPHPVPLPNLNGFRVDFGLYSGQYRAPQPDPLPPTRAMRAASRKVRRVQAGEAGADQGALDTSSMGEGSGLEDTTLSFATASILAQLQIIGTLDVEDPQATALDAALAVARDELAAAEVRAQDDTPLERLRVAECLGIGLQTVVATPAEGEDGVVALSTGAAKIGDILFAPDGTRLVVRGVDEQGRIVGVVGLPQIDEESERPAIRPTIFAPQHFTLQWRPSRKPRRWATEGRPTGEYDDLATAMVALVRLWGETEGAREADLSVAGTFVATVLTMAGLRHRGLSDGDDDTVMAYLDRFGEGVRKRAAGDETDIEVGDLVRFRRGKFWGVCTRVAEKGLPLDVLVQGGARRAFGEPEWAVTLQKGVELSAFSHTWRPSSKRRD